MLTLILPSNNEESPIKLQFEHSLVSLSKWEAIHEKPFYNKEPQTIEETYSYIEQMLLSENPPENFTELLTLEHLKQVQEYINSKQTATTFRENPNEPKSREIITNEVIYQWLVAFRIPFYPVETWHINRLMTLVRVCGIKQTKPKKMTAKEVAERNRQLNEERRRQLGTSG